MKLLMARSQDGFFARGPADDCSWTGSFDKKMFRLLTHLGNGRIGAGRTTFKLLSGYLKHRFLVCLTRGGINLEAFAEQNGEWCIGGPTVAMEAVKKRLVDQIIFNTIFKDIGESPEAIPDVITPNIGKFGYELEDHIIQNNHVMTTLYRRKD